MRRPFSVRDPKDFSTLLEINAIQAAQVEAERVTPKDIVGIDEAGLAIVRTRTLEITNDEDDPEEWHVSLTFLFRTSGQTPQDVCQVLAADGSAMAVCQDDHTAIGSGIAAVTHGIPADSVIGSAASEAGPALAIRRWPRSTAPTS